MTNAIEQTKREMYELLAEVGKELRRRFIKFPDFDGFESSLEAHLEALRQRNEVQRQIIEESGGTNDLTYRLGKMTEWRDTLRNQLQALQMASSTAAEVIRGLRSELEEVREDMSKPVANDIYMMGFNGLGTPCPYPTNTIERLHWMDGARERMGLLNQNYGVMK